MAFVKIENKVSEQEIVVFPSIFEQFGGKLEQDNVIKVTGKVNAKDKNGNFTTDIKVLAENIELISDDALENYQSTGEKLVAPVLSKQSSGSTRRYTKVSAEPVAERPKTPQNVNPPADDRKKRLFCLVKDPNNTEVLSEIKHLCDLNPGLQEIILVLEDETGKKPLKMPFKVDATSDLTAPLEKLLGQDCVKVV